MMTKMLRVKRLAKLISHQIEPLLMSLKPVRACHRCWFVTEPRPADEVTAFVGFHAVDVMEVVIVISHAHPKPHPSELIDIKDREL